MKQYFGIKAHFYSKLIGKRHSTSVEERVICLTAKNLDDALRLGEAEARQYATDHNGAGPGNYTCRLIYPIEAFMMFDHPGNRPFEVFSLIHKRFPSNARLRKCFTKGKSTPHSEKILRGDRVKRIRKSG